MKIKRLISGILTVLILCMNVPINFITAAEANNVSSGKYNKCGETVHWEIDDEGTLNIRGIGEMYNWIEYKTDPNISPWFKSGDNNKIKKIIIEDGVTSIGDSAFANCNLLTEIVIPDSVVKIGNCAFFNCSNIKSIPIPNSVTEMGCGVFSGCSKLESMNISNNIDTDFLRHYASQYYRYIGTFSGCTNIKYITLPKNIKTISSYTFSGCDSLSDIYYLGTEEEWNNINSGVNPTYDTFRDSLKNVSIHFSNKNMCGDNLTWEFDEEAGKITISGTGDMWDYEEGSSPFSEKGEKIKSIVIESGATSIGADAFENCTELNNVKIPETVKKIGSIAFLNCCNLNKIDLPDSLEKIENRTFLNSGIWTSQTWSKSNRSIVKYADNWVIGYDDYNTADISESDISYMKADTYYVKTIREGTKGIADNAFLGADSYSFALPDSLEIIGESAFESCPKLRSITIPQNVKKIDKRALYSTKLRSVTFETLSCDIYDAEDTIYIGADLWTLNYSEDIENYWHKYISKNENRHYIDMKVGNSRYFKPERDGNSFTNAREETVKDKDDTENKTIGNGFAKGSYWNLSLDYFWELKKNFPIKNHILSFKKHVEELYIIASDLFSEYGNIGWCFGIASTMAMNYNDKTHLYKITNNKDYYELTRPAEKKDLYYALNYYMLSQTIHSGAEIIDSSFNNIGLDKALKEIAERTSDYSKAYIINFSEPTHAVLANGCIKLDNNGGYLVRLFDEDFSVISWMHISSDYSSYQYLSGTGQKYIGSLNSGSDKSTLNNGNEISFYDADILSSKFTLPEISRSISSNSNETMDRAISSNAENSSKIHIVFDIDSDFKIENNKGEVLEYKSNICSGSMSVYKNKPLVFEGIKSRRSLEIDYSESFMLTNNSNSVSVDIFDDNNVYLSIAGTGIKKAEFDFTNNSVKTSGDDYSFKAYINTQSEVAEDEEGLISISGKTTGKVNIFAENGKVEMAAENTVKDIKVKSYVETESKEYEIADKSGFTLNVDSEGNAKETDNTIVTTTPPITTTTASTTTAITSAATTMPITSAAVTSVPTTVTTSFVPVTTTVATTASTAATTAQTTTPAVSSAATTMPVTSTAVTSVPTTVTTSFVPVTTTVATTVSSAATTTQTTTTAVSTAATTMPVTSTAITSVPTAVTTSFVPVTTAVATTISAAATTVETTTTAVSTAATTAETSAITISATATTAETVMNTTVSTSAIVTTTAAVTTNNDDENTDTSGWYYEELEDGTAEITGYEDDEVEKLTIPKVIDGKAVTKLGEEAFYGFMNLEEVIIPNGVKEIGIWAFAECTSLKKVIIPDSLTMINDFAFYKCGFEEIKLPDSVTYLGLCVFMECYKLKKADLPDSITEIEGGLFIKCTKLEEVKLPEKTESLNGAHLVYDDGTHYYFGFFDTCESLKSIVLPESLTLITGETFYGCENLEKLTILNRKSIEIEDAMETIPSKTKIYGYGYADIQYYALKHRHRYYLIDADNALSGDISGNGGIDLYDAIAIARSMMPYAPKFTEKENMIADLNADGIVGLYDAIEIAKYMVGK